MTDLSAIKILASGIDEWYGVEARFKWPEPYSPQAWLAAPGDKVSKLVWKSAADLKKWKAEDEAVIRTLTAKVKASAEWKAFWDKPHSVAVEDMGDGPGSVVALQPSVAYGVPQDWKLDEEGGWMSWSDR